MTPGERIRLFRVLNGATQEDVAAVLEIAQRNIAMIESNRFSPRLPAINAFGDLFNLEPEYIQTGQGNPFRNGIGLLILPPVSFSRYKRDRGLSVRKKNEAAEIVSTLFLEFLAETGVKEFSVGISEARGNIYLFPVADGYLLLKVVDTSGGTLWGAASHALSRTKLEKTREVKVTADVFNLLDSEITTASIGALRKVLLAFGVKRAGVSKITKDLTVYLAAGRHTMLSTHAFYSTRVRSVAEQIKKYNLKLTDIQKYLEEDMS